MRGGGGTARAGQGPTFLLSPLGIVFTTVVIDLVGFGMVLPILPLWAERFDASPTQIGLLTASYAVVQLLFAPVWGRLSDRYGRRPVILASLAGSAVSALLIGVAGTLLLLFVARILQGVAGASYAAAQAYVADVTTRRERARGHGPDRGGLRARLHPGPGLRRRLLGDRPPPALLRRRRAGGDQPAHRLAPSAGVAAPRRAARAGPAPRGAAAGAGEPRAGAAGLALVRRHLRLRRHGVHLRALRRAPLRLRPGGGRGAVRLHRRDGRGRPGAAGGEGRRALRRGRA